MLPKLTKKFRNRCRPYVKELYQNSVQGMSGHHKGTCAAPASATHTALHVGKQQNKEAAP